MSTSKNDTLNQAMSKAEKAAFNTNISARAIIQNEAIARDSKTDRLRKERLAKEASAPVVEEPKTAKRRKAKG
ncbi:hypothetical protein HGP17_27280 [Rhizobium sp. P38BS-XIX]|uniref:hypothetical protein n=1 Tax=Rhizobium sp. P38BS-XIX TaxID=2726740 RepID=UPI0014571D84|nr:hypothetical protein [Rhizobium sp. P38BS-XIX]NLS00549.1 hypothetical protein [Rhizobium sp. P38BS-XIX]